MYSSTSNFVLFPPKTCYDCKMKFGGDVASI